MCMCVCVCLHACRYVSLYVCVCVCVTEERKRERNILQHNYTLYIYNSVCNVPHCDISHILSLLSKCGWGELHAELINIIYVLAWVNHQLNMYASVGYYAAFMTLTSLSLATPTTVHVICKPYYKTIITALINNMNKEFKTCNNSAFGR